MCHYAGISGKYKNMHTLLYEQTIREEIARFEFSY